MVEKNMDWMTQGPLTLLGVLQKMPSHVDNLLTKYGLEKIVKVENHLDNFYLHMQKLEVHYDDVSWKRFPCTLDGRPVVWYHNLPTNSIDNWRGFKKTFLQNFVKDKTPSMLLKELGNLKMEKKEKVKDFNQRFNHILNKFLTTQNLLTPLPYITTLLPCQQILHSL